MLIATDDGAIDILRAGNDRDWFLSFALDVCFFQTGRDRLNNL